MSYEQKDNSGSLFVNDRKEKENQPDYKGSMKVGGVEYWISGWKKTSNGKDWISFAYSPKLPQGQPQQPVQQVPSAQF